MNFYTFLFCFTLPRLILSDASLTKTINDDDIESYKPFHEAEINPMENEIKYWKQQATQLLIEKLNRPLNTNLTKNIIFFLGDGMSIPTITAARIYAGQLNNKTGEEYQLSFEKFPYTGLTKTYCLDKQVGESACTGTALMSGVKANFKCIGVSGNVKRGDCEAAKNSSNRPISIMELAQRAGKATGIVTNTRITHASPAGCYAHVPDRDMESDGDVKDLSYNTTACDFDIAKQLMTEEPGKNVRVLLGGGRSKFLPVMGVPTSHGLGNRLDADLIDLWKKSKGAKSSSYVTNAKELENVNLNETDFLLGLFADSHMTYDLERPDTEPPLWKMTETAIKMLQKETNGYFLFVEGGLIDVYHHSNQAHIALHETIQFAKAVEMAVQMTSDEDTLIIVTSDHSHTMSMSGYPTRGFNIFYPYGKDADGLPYSSLSYANGPGFKNNTASGTRHDLSEDAMNATYAYPATVPKLLESHGGDDVAVYARGPWAHLFSGNYEQNYIPIAEAFAANITCAVKSNANSTDNSANSADNSTNTANSTDSEETSQEDESIIDFQFSAGVMHVNWIPIPIYAAIYFLIRWIY